MAPLALGDSTMLLSLPALAARGYDANAQGCRQFYQALALLRQLQAQGALPHTVVIALGANGPVTPGDISQALELLCCNRLLVLVTARGLGGGSGPEPVTERQAAKQHPGRILLLDWVKYSQGHPKWFQPDGLHLTWPGAYAFADLLARAIPYAYAPCPVPARERRRHRIEVQWARITERRSGLAPVSSAAPFSIRATIAHLGFVGATINGPAGARVQLSQRLNGQETSIRIVQLSGSGTLTVPRAATWLCAPRIRQLIATTLPPAMMAQVTSTVQTPSCSRRLDTEINPRAQVRRSIMVHFRDRWGIGGFGFAICLVPPGARARCTPWHLRLGQRQRIVHLAVPRPGGWHVTVKPRFGQPVSKIVWATYPGGRIALLAAGDSEMQILDDFIAQDLGAHAVNVTNDARISTGLTNSFFFDWQAESRQQANALRPDVSVVFMGANDGFSVSGPGGGPVQCCGSPWSTGYSALVAEMMRSLLRGRAGRVYWFLLPTPRPSNFQYLFDGVNRGIQEAATRFRGRVAVIDADAFFTPHNQYRDYMVYHGQGVVIHEADGIHLSIAADQIAATLLVRRLVADRVIR